ncbi:MAG: hypothetical protein ACE5FH_01745 [Candidatus Zixiibacteriota bacterium]
MGGSKKRIVAYVIFGAALTYWANTRLGSKDKNEMGLGPAPTAIQPVSLDSNRVVTTRPLIDIAGKLSEPWGADPFQSPKARRRRTAVEKPVHWILSGIVYRPENPMAVINRRTVRPGDVIDGATVVDIKRKSVTIEHRGKNVTLSVTKG